MGSIAYTSNQQCLVPGDCYNMASLARLRAGGYLQVGLTDLSDNVVFLTASRWRCWNRRLNEDLLSWSDFHPGSRTSLDAPVECTLTIHHPYSRTIIYRVYDSLQRRLQHELLPFDSADTDNLLILPLGQGRHHYGRQR
jgi:hypothetical protein